MPGRNKCSYDRAKWRQAVVRKRKAMRGNILRILKTATERRDRPVLLTSYYSLKQ